MSHVLSALKICHILSQNTLFPTFFYALSGGATLEASHYLQDREIAKFGAFATFGQEEGHFPLLSCTFS